MNITRDQILKTVEAYYEDVFNHMDYPKSEEDRREFFNQKNVYRNASDMYSNFC